MENIKTEVKGDTLTITVNLSHDGGMSNTGKTRRIASSLGNKPIDGADGAIMGLNIYRKVA